VGGALNVMELPTTKIDEPIHLHPEDGNWNDCRNVGQLPIFAAAHNQKPKLYIATNV
jgi:hypothetical protein